LKTVLLVAGARPNFMKIAPIVRAIKIDGRLDYKIIHTGQHYDREMNEVFFEEFGIPEPDVFMGVGSGTHAEQTARILIEFERLCLSDKPNAVVVVGDVNSTLACSLAAKKLLIPVAHVEAGLRSGDMAMPEEINRVVTDAISDMLFVTEPSGVANLRREGKLETAIHFVGNVMIDNLIFQRAKLERSDQSQFAFASFKRSHGEYGVVTLHRPSNVDNAQTLGNLAGALRTISDSLPLIFPVHPRTRASLERHEIELGPNISLIGPLPYMEFLNLWKDAAVVLTDSGGLQEETTALGVQCVTLRENTERPITIDEGTNQLAGTDPERILKIVSEALARGPTATRRPHLWDGRAAERIVSAMAEALHC
jgi:UDP-N-acetylglucosamine 2-epimerase (non-hydrolysing)